MFRAVGDDELLDIMLKMRFSEVRRGRVDNILKEALAMQVFCILVNDHAESARVSFGSDVTGKIIIHISSHFEDITLDKLSRVFHFTPEYISKLVKKATGKSFTSLVIGLKLAAAKRLLISTDLEVIGNLTARSGSAAKSSSTRNSAKKTGAARSNGENRTVKITILP